MFLSLQAYVLVVIGLCSCCYRSMFFDEDGDLAHEFYEEVCEDCKYVMRRSWNNLVPQVIFTLYSCKLYLHSLC